MRRVVVVEGQEYPWGTVEKGALTVKGDKVPIIQHGPIGIAEFLGWASEFERNDETGEISFVLNLEHLYLQPDDWSWYDVYVMCSPVNMVDNKIISGRILEVEMTPIGDIPKGVLR